MDSIDWIRYSGTWHEWARAPGILFQLGCPSSTVVARYDPIYDPHDPNKLMAIRVVNSCRRFGFLPSSAEGTGVPVGPTSLHVSFDQIPDRSQGPNYRVLATDYDHWAVVTGPKDNNGRTRMWWILGRRPYDQSSMERLETLRAFVQNKVQ